MTLQVPWDFMQVQKRLRKYSASSFRLLSCFSSPEASLLLLYVNLALLDFAASLDVTAMALLCRSHADCIPCNLCGLLGDRIKALAFGWPFLGIGSSGQAAVPCVQSPQRHYLGKEIL